MLRLLLVSASTSALPDGSRSKKYLEGEDETELLDAWNQLSGPGGGWGNYSPAAFRSAIVHYSGADVDMPAEDDEILPAVVEALGPNSVRLERV